MIFVLSSFRTSLPRLSGELFKQWRRSFSYVQGQVNEKRREYFYFIDHQGQLFLDDARIKNFTSCFKDKEFLVFFFQRLGLNETGNYEAEFPYVSPCGRERNYVRCDDVPVVFTHFLEDDRRRLSWGGAGDRLAVDFRPEAVCMLPSTGRVYHPSDAVPGRPLGLIRSNLAIELARDFEFDDGEENPPTYLNWAGRRVKLTNELVHVAERFSTVEES